MQCGCTLESPSCARGEVLFALLVQAQHHLNTASREDREEQWEIWCQARIPYLDHLYGWRQSDLRVRFQCGTWLIERRHQDQWPLQFGTTNKAELRSWLREGFWRYAQLDEQEMRDGLTGYYHQRASLAFLSDSSREHTRPMAQPLVGQQQGKTQSTTLFSKEVVRPELEPKTQVALMIAVQIGLASHPPTPLDHLTLQRKAVDLLLASGVQHIEADDIAWIQGVIEEAVRLRETQQQPQDRALPQS